MILTLVLVVALAAFLLFIFFLLRRPTEEECLAPTIWSHGEDDLVRQGFRSLRRELKDVGKRRLWLLEHEDAKRTIVVIPGYAHRGAHFAPMVREMWSRDQVILFDRSGICAERPTNIGWMSIQDRRREALELINTIISEDLVRGELIVVGHSEGATFLPLIAAEHPDLVTTLVLMGPVPARRGAVLTNISYMIRSLGSLPSTMRALIHGTGVVVPKRTARLLFTNGSLTDDEFAAFYAGLVPDSALAFLQLLLFYSGVADYANLRRADWKGRIIEIAADHDTLVSVKTLRQMADAIGATLVELAGEPHCFFAEGISEDAAAALHKALD